MRDQRGNHVRLVEEPIRLTVIPVPGLSPSGPEVVSQQTISAGWIPAPDVLVPYGQSRLVGGFVLCTGGANNGRLRRITDQVQGLLTFDPFPDPIDAAFTYAIVLPRVERTDLPEGLSIFETWTEFLYQFLIYDVGDKQWFAGLSRWDQVEIEAAVGEGPAAVNEREDVMKVQARLAQLGFDWIRIDGDAGPVTRTAIRLFQAMTRGDEVVGPGHQDGRVDTNGETLKWLNAEKAPRWGLMPTGATGLGYTNVEVTLQPHDRGDWGGRLGGRDDRGSSSTLPPPLAVRPP